MSQYQDCGTKSALDEVGVEEKRRRVSLSLMSRKWKRSREAARQDWQVELCIYQEIIGAGENDGSGSLVLKELR